VLGTQGAQAHVQASLRVRRPPMDQPLQERPLQKRPHSDFVVREAAKEAAGLKGTEERPGMYPDSQNSQPCCCRCLGITGEGPRSCSQVGLNVHHVDLLSIKYCDMNLRGDHSSDPFRVLPGM